MNNIYFKSSQELTEFHKLFYWKSGSEGNIYRIPDGIKNILLKLFYNPFNGASLPEKTIQNKRKKISTLKKMVLPNRVQVKGNVFLDDKFIGYILTEAMNYQDLCFNSFTTFQKLEFLRRLKTQLQRFHALGIIYGDLKSNNVLSHISNYKLGCLCDLDNMQVKGYPIDITSDYVDEFLFQYGDINEKLDWYMFNLLTLETIFGLDKTTYMAYIETRSFMNNYTGNCSSLKAMQHITSLYKGDLLIDDPRFYEEIGIQYYKKR